MLRPAAILFIIVATLFAQADTKRPAGTDSLEQRIAVIETKLDNLKTLDDRVSKLNDKIDALNLQLAAVNTKLELIQWFGGAIGLLVLGSLWSSLAEKFNSRTQVSRDETIRNEVARILAVGDYADTVPENASDDPRTQRQRFVRPSESKKQP